MKYILDLSGQKPLFYGSNRSVYLHPDDPDLLVKVPHRKAVKSFGSHMPKWKRRFKLLGGGLPQSFREFKEYMRLNLTAAERLPFIFVSAGFIATTEGWAHVVRVERDAQGNYAPTLGSIINQPEKYEKPLKEFLQWAENTPAAFSNMEPWNLVLAHRDGKDEIVSIDGIGERSFIPWRAFFPSLNKRKNKKKIERLLARIEQMKTGYTDEKIEYKMSGTVARGGK